MNRETIIGEMPQGGFIMSNTVVNTNVLALNAHRNLGKVGQAQTTASERLSSGLRINSAADDAAGLAISEKMRSQIRGLDQASTNAQDGTSLVQTAEGGMQEIDNMVQRMRELTVQAANDTNEAGDRKNIQLEITQLTSEIDSMSSRVEFNGKTLLDGSLSTGGTDGPVNLQIGANSGQLLEFEIGAMDSATLGIDTATLNDVGTSTSGDISANLSTLDSALTKITDARANLGATQNRLEYTQSSLDISSENLSASESRIRDADMAEEMMNLTQANVLQQAATSMLSQANQAPQNVLSLLN